jgi:His/Glu/Gln/Arg/opine family amino acid ABC transporter permease subunit
MSVWIDKLYETFIESGYYVLIIKGFANTLIISLGAIAISLVIGSLIAVTRYFGEDSKKLKPLTWLCDLYVTAIRGIPVVVLLLIFYYVVLKALNGVTVAIIAFGVNSGAYMAEIIRSGINAVDSGQMEAGRSLGLSKMKTMRKVIFPQAVRYILPAIGNEFIALRKETSVAGYVAVMDLTRAGNLVRNNSFDQVNPLMVVALTYLIVVILLTRLLGRVEKKLAKERN